MQPGLTFFFPAAVVTVAAGAALGWLGVLAVIAANFIMPWGAASDPLRQALFALPPAAWAGLVALLPRSSGSPWSRLHRFLLHGILGGSLLSALTGAAVLTLLGGPLSRGAFSLTAGLWWASDFTPALALGLPVLVLLVPEMLLDGNDLVAWRA